MPKGGDRWALTLRAKSLSLSLTVPPDFWRRMSLRLTKRQISHARDLATRAFAPRCTPNWSKLAMQRMARGMPSRRLPGLRQP